MRLRNIPHIAANRVHRSGSVLVAVLVCFGVVAAILLGVTQSSLMRRRQLKREYQMEQTRILADAGVVFAIGHFKDAEADTWNETAVELADYSLATVKWRFDADEVLDVVATVSHEDRPDRGTTFEIQLPAEAWKYNLESKK